MVLLLLAVHRRCDLSNYGDGAHRDRLYHRSRHLPVDGKAKRRKKKKKKKKSVDDDEVPHTVPVYT